tara:strand:- start:247 stop:759 length:513 start_codon:yes stop_codon:yes gene_type:complete
MRISKGYWIWAQFDYSCTLKLSEIKKQVMNLVKGPEFDIHLTLSGPLSGTDESINEQFLGLKDHIKSIRIDTSGYGFKQKYFESLFIGVKKSKKLLNLKEFVDSKFSIDAEEYFPHISLFYGLEKKSIKSSIINQLPQLPSNIIIDKISLVRVDENIELWEVVQQVELLS